MSGREKDVTALLRRASRGDAVAAEEVYRELAGELRLIARSYMRRQPEEHTLQATALVNEAYLRLVRQHDVEWQCRKHFLVVAAKAMRTVLIDHARGKQRSKRDGGERVALDSMDGHGLVLDEGATPVDFLDLHDALARLETVDPKAASVVELRFFAGLSAPEAARALDMSLRTANRAWAFARSWLLRELS